MVTRRELLMASLATGALAGLLPSEPATAADGALLRLVEGNRRFAESMAQHPDESVGLRMKLSQGQHPFAVVLTCSDSRVAPELIFDQGLGDLFVIRVAGNIVDSAVVGSIEYAAAHLDVPLVFVLGHEKCGAVQAALRMTPEAHIQSLASAIQPAVEKVRTAKGDLLDNSVRENARQSAGQLAASHPILAERIGAGKLKIVSGYYGLNDGRVEIF